MARAEQQPYSIAAATAAVSGSLIPVPGGVFVRDPAGPCSAPWVPPVKRPTTTRVAAVAGIEVAGRWAQPD
jgi:hypothetical protein